MQDYDVHFTVTLSNFVGSFEADSIEQAKTDAIAMLDNNRDYLLKLLTASILDDEIEIKVEDVLTVNDEED